MNYLIKGLKVTKDAIVKHKFLFILLLVLQITFFVVFSAITANYFINIAESAQSVIEPVENANFDAESLEAGQPFLKDTTPILESYNIMKTNVFNWVMWIFVALIIFNGLMWVISHRLLEKKQNLVKQIMFFIVPFVIFLALIYLIATVFLNFSMFDIVAGDLFSKAIIFVMISLVLYYLLLVMLANLNVKSWKELLKNLFDVGIKKIHKVLPVVLINGLLVFVINYLFYLFSGSEAFMGSLLSIIMFIFILILVIARIYWIACLKEIKNG